jgi:hypothetical protein
MSLISIDVESDGPIPYKYSMVCFGAVEVNNISNTFYGKVKPISPNYIPEALAISGFSREEHSLFNEPFDVMQDFYNWLMEIKKRTNNTITMISDNPAFDWQWINYYFHMQLGMNPLGFSARRIGDLYCGFVKDGRRNSEWKRKLRKTKHTHNPVDDAKGNAEAIIAMKKMGLNINL